MVCMLESDTQNGECIRAVYVDELENSFFSNEFAIISLKQFDCRYWKVQFDFQNNNKI